MSNTPDNSWENGPENVFRSIMNHILPGNRHDDVASLEVKWKVFTTNGVDSVLPEVFIKYK